MKKQLKSKRAISYISLFVTFAICFLALLSSTPAHAATKKQVSYNGVSFSYDASLASSVTAETVPEQIGDRTGSGWWLTHPQHVKFTFNNFAATNPIWEPTIYIYPIKSSYQYLTPGWNNDLWLDAMNSTHSLVAQKQQLDPYRYADVANSGGAPKTIPFLPLINAGAFFVGQQRFLHFQNGIGFRAFTTMGQDYELVTADSTFYTYQGISADGKLYVAATFPAFLSNPPASFVGPDGYTDEYAYNRVTIKAIEGSNSSQFSPSLDKLDAVIESLTASAATPATPGMPSTGEANTQRAPLVLLAALVALAAGLSVRRSSQT
jgi:hypothetical protein